MAALEPSAASLLPVLEAGKESWHLYVHKLRSWVPAEGSDPPGEEGGEDGGDEEAPVALVRPYLLLLVSVGDGAFLSCAGGEEDEEPETNVVRREPSPETLAAFVRRCMAAPRVLNSSMAGAPSRTPGRPTQLAVAHTSSARTLAGCHELWPDADCCPYVAPLKALLSDLEIPVSFAPVPPALLALVRAQIEAQFNPPEAGWGTRLMPGLSECVEGFSDAFGASLFAACACFHRSKAWANLPCDAVLQVHYRIPLGQDGLSARVNSWVVRTGEAQGSQGGWGLAVYATEELAAGALAASVARSEGVAEPPSRGQSVTFVTQPDCPFGDLDAVEALGWEVATDGDHQAYPLFVKVSLADSAAPDEEATLEIDRPSLLELQAFELALQALTSLFGSVRDSQEWPASYLARTCAAKGAPEDILVEVSVCEARVTDTSAYL
jgi:hypothetical protein